MIKILIAEDDSLLRRTLVELMELDPEFSVVSHVANGQTALEHAGVTRPEVVLTDIEMPQLDGIELTRRLKEAFPETAIVILTKFDDDEKLFAAVRAGACGYVLKDAPIDEIKDAVREAKTGGGHLNPALVARVMAEFQRISTANAHRKELFSELTRREMEVLEMLGRGMKNKAIASELFLSEKTVKTHVGAVLKKLQVNDRTEAALLANKHGI